MRKTAGLFIAVILLTPNAWASRTPAHEAAESQEYGRKAGGMVGRGLINLSTCFVDLLVNVVNETKNGPPFVGTLVGLGKGAGCTTLRALSGATDVVTFWVPGFNGFPVSDSYDNCLATSAGASAPMMSTSEPAAVAMPSHSTAPAMPGKPEETPRYSK